MMRFISLLLCLGNSPKLKDKVAAVVPNVVKSKCESAQDCDSNQVCYLPTNECVYQVSTRTTIGSQCTTRAQCGTKEICYLPYQECVCELNTVPVNGACQPMAKLDCKSGLIPKYTDEYDWVIQPYCNATTSDIKQTNGEDLHLGVYTNGTGFSPFLQEFEGGTFEKCRMNRRSEMMYLCYCNEFDCTNETRLEHTKYHLFVGEFLKCVYSFYVSTPLACPKLVS